MKCVTSAARNVRSEYRITLNRFGQSVLFLRGETVRQRVLDWGGNGRWFYVRKSVRFVGGKAAEVLMVLPHNRSRAAYRVPRVLYNHTPFSDAVIADVARQEYHQRRRYH